MHDTTVLLCLAILIYFSYSNIVFADSNDEELDELILPPIQEIASPVFQDFPVIDNSNFQFSDTESQSDLPTYNDYATEVASNVSEDVITGTTNSTTANNDHSSDGKDIDDKDITDGNGEVSIEYEESIKEDTKSNYSGIHAVHSTSEVNKEDAAVLAASSIEKEHEEHIDSEDDHEIHALSEILELQRLEAEEHQIMRDQAAKDVEILEQVDSEQGDRSSGETVPSSGRKVSSYASKDSKAAHSNETERKTVSSTSPGSKLNSASRQSDQPEGTTSGSERMFNTDSTPVKGMNTAEFPGSKKLSGSNFGLNSGSLKNLEAMFLGQQAVRARAAELDEQEEINLEKRERFRRYRVKRSYASPVEEILRVYNDDETTLYQVLGVSPEISELELKKLYRTKALIIHPDKNPHPDAKSAFDALQDAFNTIASPLKRSQYDQQLRRVKRARRVTIRRLRKWTYEYFDNQFSRLQLIVHQLRKGEFTSEYGHSISNWYSEKKKNAQYFLQHLILLPGLIERLKLFHERLWQYRSSIIAPIMIISSVL